MLKTATRHSATLGADLRRLRKARKLTLARLAEKIECSVGWLSQVERNLSVPDLLNLKHLARALDVSVESLMPKPTQCGEEGLIVRKNARRPIGNRNSGLVETLLSPDLTDHFEVIHSIFEPYSALKTPRTRPTHELGYVLSGQLDLWIEGKTFTVNAQDSFRIRGESYRWENPYDTPCAVIWVISPPVY